MPSHLAPQRDASIAARKTDVGEREPPPLLPPEVEGSLFWQIRIRAARTIVRQTLTQATFRLLLICLLGGILWLVLFYLFHDGFLFMRDAVPIGDLREDIVRYVLGTFFMTLAVMLVFSSAIIIFGAAFRGADTVQLLTLPVRPERVFWMKYQEAVLLSSWGFLFLGTPVLVAYGVSVHAPWPYYAMMLPLMISFVYIPSAVGALVTLGAARFVSRLRNLLIGAGFFAVFAAGYLVIQWLSTVKDANVLTIDWLEGTLSRLRITQFRVLPSWWLTTGLLSFAHNQTADGTMFFAVLTTNSLVANQIVGFAARRSYRRLYQSVAGRRGRRRGSTAAFRVSLFDRLFRFLSPQVRLLIRKDVRIFRRDPIQWLQTLIFGGLLAFYFLNMQRLYYDRAYAQWINSISLLNLAVIGLLLSTFTTRFVFPLISLEGLRFWILGQLPLDRNAVVWSKLTYGVIGSLIPVAALVALSDAMLGVDTMVFLSHQLCAVLMSLGLSAIAVGLGARFPNFREESPSRIAAGFGGTLNLVVSTFYNVFILLSAALPVHLEFLSRSANTLPVLGFKVAISDWIALWAWLGPMVAVFLCLLTTVVTLIVGIRHFRKIEF
ncbi:hypothetical protein JCM19992_20090 [Thermostilla marina]